MHVMLVPFYGAQLPQRGFLGYGLAEGVHPWRPTRGVWPLETEGEGAGVTVVAYCLDWHWLSREQRYAGKAGTRWTLRFLDLAMRAGLQCCGAMLLG